MLHDEFPDVTISKIRFLESQGLIDPERTPSGYRKFYPADIERLRFILHEQKEHFLPLKVIRDRLEETSSEHPDADNGDASPPPSPEGSEPSEQPPEPAATRKPSPPTPPPPAPAPPAAPERLPVWMTQRPARSRNPLLTGGVEGSGASYTLDEVASASGLTREQVSQAEQFGLLSGRVSGHERYYGQEAVAIAKAVAGFLRFGIEPRHLRAFKNAADREVGLYEQVILPLLKQRNPEARAQAVERLSAMADLGRSLHNELLRHSLREYLD
jgi:DNA-binding transcriptional MerR regulator